MGLRGHGKATITNRSYETNLRHGHRRVGPVEGVLSSWRIRQRRR